MKKVPIGEIQEKSNEEIISDLHACRYSLLDSMGCRKLRLEMFLPGKISAVFVRYLIWKAKRKSGKNWTTTVRSYIIKLFKSLRRIRLIVTTRCHSILAELSSDSTTHLLAKSYALSQLSQNSIHTITTCFRSTYLGLRHYVQSSI